MTEEQFAFVQPDIISYHHPCPDGTSCTILLREKWPDVDFVPHIHGKVDMLTDEKEMEKVNGKIILCVDWCPNVEQLLRLARHARKITIVDHHITAVDVANEIMRRTDICVKCAPIDFNLSYSSPCASVIVFELLNGKKAPRPEWLRAIDLYDTGKFDLMTEQAKHYHKGLTRDLAKLDEQRRKPREEIEQLGQQYLEHDKKEIQSALEHFEYKLLTVKYKTYNMGYVPFSNAGAIQMCAETFFQDKQHGKVDILAFRFVTSNGMDFKLRRPPHSTLDLGRFAAQYKSGGHKEAAGIQIANRELYLPDILE